MLEDPVGSLGLKPKNFIELTKLVQDVANVHAQGPNCECA
jgi:hypothetical protein